MAGPDAVRKRSPRAPSIPLDDALDKALKIYDKERLHPAPTDVVALTQSRTLFPLGGAKQALERQWLQSVWPGWEHLSPWERL